MKLTTACQTALCSDHRKLIFSTNNLHCLILPAYCCTSTCKFKVRSLQADTGSIRGMCIYLALPIRLIGADFGSNSQFPSHIGQKRTFALIVTLQTISLALSQYPVTHIGTADVNMHRNLCGNNKTLTLLRFGTARHAYFQSVFVHLHNSSLTSITRC